MGNREEQRLFRELTGYEKNSVGLKMNGAYASPLQIVRAHMMREGNGYMRDYVLNDVGDIQEVNFNQIESMSS